MYATQFCEADSAG